MVYLRWLIRRVCWLSVICALAGTTIALADGTERVAEKRPPIRLKRYLNDLYLDHSVGFRVGRPTTEQNMEIHTKEIYFQKEFIHQHIGLMIPSFELSVAQLNGGKHHGYNYSTGPALAIPLTGFSNKMRIIVNTKVHWLTRHEYKNLRLTSTKRYGGPVQWSYTVGAKYQIETNTFLEYNWFHMSNGDRYDFNPGLETHNFSIGVNF